ncbi:HNH endonuclease [Anabaena cylindrica FACHB-243]|uniref:HNH endonuclease n=1 Tax=Anabaena cylindrica (strain ATCC 27899 / PCC 7122) TaxID=272123 RepID=K9ZLM6_ANACC|nr:MULTISPECIES: HNH endonuclease signature motif containing protein [Anabaena]AFZ59684.1 HNH endonuclease [Anabaena cylindrica PCC 7122]MBD2418654.1 HNH endonuclease [Anabaena cylindrica FACHB-243]MBY5283397.1 HNH endonuclease [Anabaena sp. CCAP 1446/1C]MBY5307748.1 HNH endonuclease [Anabaena sp. CCAP 1446/1C]MCM2406216.1 HNH endonuclease [Anabaena sp. CCAP 1446/1C]
MSAYISVELKEKIRHCFADCCAYCRTAEFLTVTTFEFEHIIPRSADGETVFENLCLACPSCNRYKATRQTAIDPNTQEEVKLFHPQQQSWIQHFTWSEDATEIVGLTPVARVTISALKMNRSQLTRVRKMWVKMGEHPPNI